MIDGAWIGEVWYIYQSPQIDRNMELSRMRRAEREAYFMFIKFTFNYTSVT